MGLAVLKMQKKEEKLKKGGREIKNEGKTT